MRYLILVLSLSFCSPVLAQLQCGSPDKGYMVELNKIPNLTTDLVVSVQVFKNGVLEKSGDAAAFGGGTSRSRKEKLQYIELGIPSKNGFTMSKVITDKSGNHKLEFGSINLDCEKISGSENKKTQNRANQ